MILILQKCTFTLTDFGIDILYNSAECYKHSALHLIENY